MSGGGGGGVPAFCTTSNRGVGVGMALAGCGGGFAGCSAMIVLAAGAGDGEDRALNDTIEPGRRRRNGACRCGQRLGGGLRSRVLGHRCSKYTIAEPLKETRPLNATAITFLELGLVLGTLITLAVFGAPLVFGAKREPLQSVPIDGRQAAEQRLLNTPPLATVATAARVYDAVQEIVARSVEANKSLETKASGVIVLSSAVLGFGLQLANAHRAQPWLAIPASIALVGAIGCAARVNFSQAFNLPSPITYNLPSIANLPDNEAKIVVELTEAWNDYAVDERSVGAEKALWLRRSFAAMLVGVGFFALMSTVALITDTSSPAAPPISTGK